MAREETRVQRMSSVVLPTRMMGAWGKMLNQVRRQRMRPVMDQVVSCAFCQLVYIGMEDEVVGAYSEIGDE